MKIFRCTARFVDSKNDAIPIFVTIIQAHDHSSTIYELAQYMRVMPGVIKDFTVFIEEIKENLK